MQSSSPDLRPDEDHAGHSAAQIGLQDQDDSPTRMSVNNVPRMGTDVENTYTIVTRVRVFLSPPPPVGSIIAPILARIALMAHGMIVIVVISRVVLGTVVLGMIEVFVGALVDR